MPLPAFLAAAIPSVIATAANVIGGSYGASKQKDYSMEIAKYQNEYNLPVNQMARLTDAGLNPNLMYGVASPGNMSAPQPVNVSAPYEGIGTTYLQAGLTSSKTSESSQKREVMKVQKEVLEANPWLNSGYVNALVSSMMSTAAMKKQEADFYTGDAKYEGVSKPGIQKMQLEIETLVQRFNLNQADQKIKAEIVQSKEFQNEIDEVKARWLTDATINPQTIMEGVKMLLMYMK